jgi:hypothetical protein
MHPVEESSIYRLKQWYYSNAVYYEVVLTYLIVLGAAGCLTLERKCAECEDLFIDELVLSRNRVKSIRC